MQVFRQLPLKNILDSLTDSFSLSIPLPIQGFYPLQPTVHLAPNQAKPQLMQGKGWTGNLRKVIRTQCGNLHMSVNEWNATKSEQNYCANSIEEHIGWREEPSWPRRKGREEGKGWWGEVQEVKGEKGRKEVDRGKASSKLLGLRGVWGSRLHIFLSPSRYERRDAFSRDVGLAEKDLAPLVQDHLALGAPHSSLHRQMDKWSALGMYLSEFSFKVPEPLGWVAWRSCTDARFSRLNAVNRRLQLQLWIQASYFLRLCLKHWNMRKFLLLAPHTSKSCSEKLFLTFATGSFTTYMMLGRVSKESEAEWELKTLVAESQSQNKG